MLFERKEYPEQSDLGLPNSETIFNELLSVPYYFLSNRHQSSLFLGVGFDAVQKVNLQNV